MNEPTQFELIREKHEQNETSAPAKSFFDAGPVTKKRLVLCFWVVVVVSLLVMTWNLAVWSAAYLNWIVRIGVCLLGLEWATGDAGKGTNRRDGTLGQLGLVVLGFALLVWALQSLLPASWFADNYIGSGVFNRIAAVFSPHNVGDKVMPKIDIVIKASEQPRLPLTIMEIKGSNLKTDGGEIKTTDVVSLADAEGYYTEFLKRNPDNIQAYIYRASSRYEQQKFSKAKEDLNNAIRLDPNDSSKYEFRGIIQAELGNEQQAMIDFDKAIALEPNSASAYYSRGFTFDNLGKFEQAIRDYKRSIRADPKDSLPFNNLAWIYATCPDQKFRNGRSAVEFASKACELDGGQDGMFLDTLAAAYAEKGDFDLAIRYVKEAIRLTKNDKSIIAEFEVRLELFKRDQPFRQSKAK